jgi:hypothetical protein
MELLERPYWLSYYKIKFVMLRNESYQTHNVL